MPATTPTAHAHVRIGSVVVDPPLLLAPMAGVTNSAFRRMVKRAGGCGMVCTEMFSGYAVKYGDPRTDSMIDWTDEERPVCVQVFGGDPTTVAVAAKAMQDAGADIVDINLGCPVPKVAKSGSGAALLRDLGRVREIFIAAREALEVPLTAKTRLGWSPDCPTGIELAQAAQVCGLDAITVHGRYASQGYTGSADWEAVANIKREVRIPVILNGDIRTPEGAARALESTGCDGLMIGRAALGNPWVFHRIEHYLRTGELLPEATAAQRLEAAREHARLLQELLGDRRAANEMRGHLVYYVKGMPGAPALRDRIMKTRSVEEIGQVLDEASRQH